jgi:hypothetical protein
MTSSIYLRILLSATMSWTFVACDFGGDLGLSLGPGAGPTSVPPAVRVDPSGDVGLAVGETVALTATYHDSSGKPVSGVAFEWRSSNTTVAQVSTEGIVAALSVGSASIIASALGVRDSAVIHVRPPALVFTEVNVGAFPCAISTDATAYCWPTSPIAVPGGHSFAKVTAGFLRHSCALENARAYCWGENDYGELGSTPITISRTPLAVSGNLAFVSVGAGNQFSCGLTPSGAAYCWGHDNFGQLGSGSANLTRCIGSPCSPTPVAVAGGLVFRSLSVGANHTCGLTANGAAFCWGANGSGTLGNGTSTDSSLPVTVAGGRRFVAISAGAYHTCAVGTDGTTYCWGTSSRGLLGSTETTLERCSITEPCSTRPVPAIKGRTLESISVGGYHSCGIEADGLAVCWGDYYEGAGFGTRIAGAIPVGRGLQFRAVSAGMTTACGLAVDGVVYCWHTGDDPANHLRDGVIVPIRVPGQR